MQRPSYIAEYDWDQLTDAEQVEEWRLLAIEEGKPKVTRQPVSHGYTKPKRSKPPTVTKTYEANSIEDTFVYDPDTGEIARKHISLKIESTSSANGHRSVQYAGKRIYSSLLAWFLYYGEWPSRKIRHLNGDRGDNRIVNLGMPGSMPTRYRAVIRKNGKTHHIGYFATPEARDAAIFAVKLGVDLFKNPPEQLVGPLG
jgi:hypothetical protein